MIYRDKNYKKSESGNIFAMLFGAVAIVGALGFTTMQMISGPITTMTKVNQKNMVDNNLMTSTKIAIMDASAQTDNGDCDGDGWVEPREWKGSALPTLNGGVILMRWDQQSLILGAVLMDIVCGIMVLQRVM